MKKPLLQLTAMLCMAFFAVTTQAQTTVFTWDVDNAHFIQPIDVASFGISYYDEDGLTPDAGTGMAPGSYGILDDGSGSNYVLQATSWFNPPATADNWVIFGPITMPLGVTTSSITWKHSMIDNNFRDGYSVLVSNTGTPAAMASGGALIRNFIDNDPLTNGVNTLTATNAFIPTSFNGTQIYIGFYHDAVDQFVLRLDDFEITQTIPAVPPVAEFSGTPVTLTPGGSVNFTDLSTGSPTAWTWAFPGSSTPTSSVQNPSGIIYPAAGCYDVTLTVSNASGNDIETKTCYIDVANPALPPDANFISDFNAIGEGDVINFFDLSTNAPTSWSWVFAGAVTPTSTDQNPTNIQYNTIGCYDVTLVATNANGTDVETQVCYIDVDCANFQVGFAYTATDLDVQFTNLSTYCESYDWDFGDGNISTLSDPSNTYLIPGTYLVDLIGYDDCTLLADFAAYNITVAFGVNSSNVGISEVAEIYNMRVHPNPSSGLFTLDFDVNGSEDVSVVVYNTLGQKISNQNFGTVEGKFTSDIDLTQMSAGLYMMQVSVGNSVQTKRIMVK
jgi:PKD repeat protein